MDKGEEGCPGPTRGKPPPDISHKKQLGAKCSTKITAVANDAHASCFWRHTRPLIKAYATWFQDECNYQQQSSKQPLNSNITSDHMCDIVTHVVCQTTNIMTDLNIK